MSKLLFLIGIFTVCGCLPDRMSSTVSNDDRLGVLWMEREERIRTVNDLKKSRRTLTSTLNGKPLFEASASAETGIALTEFSISGNRVILRWESDVCDTYTLRRKISGNPGWETLFEKSEDTEYEFTASGDPNKWEYQIIGD